MAPFIILVPKSKNSKVTVALLDDDSRVRTWDKHKEALKEAKNHPGAKIMETWPGEVRFTIEDVEAEA